jgi:hypothetical protein
MIINFRAHKISWGACKLTQTFTLIKKKNYEMLSFIWCNWLSYKLNVKPGSFYWWMQVENLVINGLPLNPINEFNSL